MLAVSLLGDKWLFAVKTTAGRTGYALRNRRAEYMKAIPPSDGHRAPAAFRSHPGALHLRSPRGAESIDSRAVAVEPTP
jgi:hypothetical protein